jgi:WD40 repeat protein
MDLDPKTLKTKFEPKELKVLNPPLQLCRVRFSPCGKLLAAGGYDGTVRRWDLEQAALPELSPMSGHGGWVSDIVFAPAGGRLYAVDSWGGLRCRSYADKDAKPIWEHKQAHEGWARAVAVSADGKTLATAGRDRTVRLWNADDGKKLAELTGHNEDVFCVAFHPDGKSLVSGDQKGGLRHWDVASARPARELDAKVLYKVDRLQDTGGVKCLAFSADGKLLAAGGAAPKNGGNVQGTPTVLLYDWAAGKVKHTIRYGVDGDVFVYDLLFHPAGFVIGVSSGNPGVGKLFFCRPGDETPFVLIGKMANTQSVSLHPDGRRLAVIATNAGSAGNGRQLKNGEYPGNRSPLHLWQMPA